MKLLAVSLFVAAALASKVVKERAFLDERLGFKMRVAALPRDPEGYFHLADDGVLRSLGPQHEVLGYVPGSNRDIMERISEWPIESEQEHLREVFKGVDGREVKEPWILPEALMNPTAKRDLSAGTSERRDVFERDPAKVYKRAGCPDSVRWHKCSKTEKCSDDNCTCEYEDSLDTGRCK